MVFPLCRETYEALGSSVQGRCRPSLVMGSTQQEIQAPTEDSPAKGHEDYCKIGASVVWKEAERAGTVLPKEEKVQWGSYQYA